MKKIILSALVTVCITAFNYFTFPDVAAALPAFPGAEGFGSDTPGGRGGRVIEVTNLDASGTGSLRAALEASGSRIVVFRTGGTILLTSDITIRNPYITIAGQTAPGDGILIRGGAIRLATHDIVIRGLRIRVGDSSNGTTPTNRDAISIENSSSPPYNIVIDHCSVSWALDENFVTWYEAHDITFQWNITSEPLTQVESGYGLLVGDYSTNVSVHHNLFASNPDRNPRIKPSTSAEVINNVIYNWSWYGTRTQGNSNIIGNYFKAGPGTAGPPITVMDAGQKVYVKDNIGPGRMSNTGDDWLLVDGSSTTRSNLPVVTPSGIVIDDVTAVYEIVLSKAGAMIPSRDAVDKRIVESVRNNNGRYVSSQNSVGGWPALNSGTPPQDSDHDGIADNWELTHGLNPNSAGDGSQDRDGDGYTNVEEYINSFFPVVIGTKPSPPGNLRIISVAPDNIGT